MSLKQQLIEQELQGNNQKVNALRVANTFIECAQQSQKEDVIVDFGQFDEAIQKMVDKLKSLQARKGTK